MHLCPTTQQKCRQCKLNSCTVGSKWAALLFLHRTETQKTGEEEHQSQWAGSRGGVRGKRDILGILQEPNRDGQSGHPLPGSVCRTGLHQVKQNGPV